MWLAQNGMADPDNAGAGAYAYMDLMGLVALGWMWLKMAAAGRARALAKGEGMERQRLLPGQAQHGALLCRARTADVGALRKKIEAGAETLMKIPAEAF